MRRFACLFLALCFIIGLLPGISLTASAEEAAKLLEATLDFSMPAAGEALPTAFNVNEGFVIEQYSWEVYRNGVWQALSQQEMVYADDQTYKLRVQLVCDTGYFVDFDSFPSGYMPAKINGESTQAAFYGDNTEQKTNNWKGVVLEKVIFGTAVPAVKQLDVSGIPTQPGSVFTAQQAALSNEHVSILDCEIYVDGEKVDTFEFGYGWYNIHINLAAADGYVLNMDRITVNGLPVEECGWEVAYGCEVGSGWISLSCEREPESGYIDGVTVSGAPSAISADAPMSLPELAVKWSNNGTVTVSQVQWVDTDYAPVSGNFILGNVYYLAITLQTDIDTPFRGFFNLELLDETEGYHTAALATASNATTAVAYIRYALLPAVNSISVLVPEPVVGDAPGAPASAADALFTIGSYEWIDLNNQTPAILFEDGHRYQLKLQILPAEGYQLEEGTTIFVNGVACQTVTNPEGQGISVEYSFLKQIDRIEISVDTPVVDAVPGIPIVLQDAPAMITQYQWLHGSTGEIVSQFAAGNHYFLDLVLQAAQGFAFTGQTEFVVNGQTVKAVLIDGGASLRMTFSLLLQQDHVQIQGIANEIHPGEQSRVPVISTDLDCITITDVQWTDEDKIPFTGTFELGNIYYLAFTLHTDALYPFAEWIRIFADGNMVSETASEDGLLAVVYIRYSLMPKVEIAEITLPMPQIGDVPGVPTLGEDVPYGILTYSWKDLSADEAVTAFQKGHRYCLYIELCPNDAAEFGDLTVLLNGEAVEISVFNNEFAAFSVEFSFRHVIDRIDLFAPDLVVGKEVNPSEIVVLTEGVVLQSGFWVNSMNFEQLSGVVSKSLYTLRAAIAPQEGFEFADTAQIYLNGQPVRDYTVSADNASCSVSYDLRDVIGDIQISGMPQISIGGSTAPITMTVPEGAPYTVQANWLLYGGDYQFAGPGGAFEEGKLYYLEILVKPAEGYRIADGATVLVDGSAFTGITMTGDIGIWLYKQYNCGLQVIEHIDLTISAPVVGQVPGSVTLSVDTHASLREFTWAYSDTGNFADAIDMLEGDIFESGFYYMISGALVADKGYVFAENLTITVNGVASNIDLGDLGVINLGDMAFLGHSFGLLQQQIQQPDPTGDSIGIVLAMLLVSAGAWLTLKKRK